MKTKRTIALALAAALGVGPAGCATIMHGTHQTIHVTAGSPGANLRVDGEPVDPGVVRLDRGKDHIVTAEEPGVSPVTERVEPRLSWGYTAIDCLIAVFTFPFGLAAPIVDVVDGAIWNLEPEHVHLSSPTPSRERERVPY